jgi:multiple sugar transport system ATP-binding protein
MAAIELEQITKTYPNGTTAVHGLDLEVADGEFLVLVGPSGCGKTTVLRMVAGLESITGGTIRIGGRVVNDMSPRDRDVAMVFQNYALYPQMTVAENIGFPLKQRKVAKDVIRKKVEDTAQILALEEWLNRKPAQLSGGQRQRVAMGRAIVREPSAFLMDEPLSNLDAKLRVQMRAEIASIQRRVGVATLYVTHDQIEAMTMGHRVAVLHNGVLQQCDEPQALYDHPANLFVAGFIGSPPMNLFEASVDAAGSTLSLGGQEIRLDAAFVSGRSEIDACRGRRVIAGFRPEHLSADPKTEGDSRICGEARFIEALGSDVLVHFALDAPTARPIDSGPDEEAATEVAKVSTCIARADPHESVKAGQRVSYFVSPRHLHLFDPDTEVAIVS